MAKHIVANLGYCKVCSEDLESIHRHHYVTCSCGSSALDGGKEYIRLIGQAISVPVYNDDDFIRVRSLFKRGGYGKDGQGEFRYTKLKDMSDEYIHAILSYGVPEWQEDLLYKEIEFRKKQSDAEI